MAYFVGNYYFTVLKFFLELFIHFDLDFVLLSLVVGIAISTQPLRIIFLVTVNTIVGIRFSTIYIIAILAHSFSIMLTVFVWAVLDGHCYLRWTKLLEGDDFIYCLSNDCPSLRLDLVEGIMFLRLPSL